MTVKNTWTNGDTVTAQDYNDLSKLAMDALAATGQSAAPVKRSGIFAFECCNASGSSWANQPFVNRRQFVITQKPSRFRVHWRNLNQLTAVDSPGTVTELQFHIGLPFKETDGSWAGNCTAVPVAVSGAAAVVPSGTEFVGPWIEPATLQLLPGVPYVFSQGLKAPPGGTLSFSSEPSWQGYASGDSAVQNLTTPDRSDNGTWGHAWIEFEYTAPSVKHIMVLANSRSNGSTVSVINNGSMTGAIQRWAMRNNAVVSNLGASGIWAGHFSTDTVRWHLYDNTVIPIAPDVVFYPDLNSSDLGGASLAIAKSNIQAVLNLGVGRWPNAKHVLTNVSPRSDFDNTIEANRLLLNNYMHLQTWNPLVDDVIDYDAALTNWASPLAAIRPPLTSDGIHLTPQGHEVLSQHIRL